MFFFKIRKVEILIWETLRSAIKQYTQDEIPRELLHNLNPEIVNV